MALEEDNLPTDLERNEDERECIMCILGEETGEDGEVIMNLRQSFLEVGSGGKSPKYSIIL